MLTDDRPEFGHSRIGRDLDPSTYRDFQNNYGLSRTALFNQVEASLRRLQTDYIDLLQLHRLDRGVDKEEVLLTSPANSAFDSKVDTKSFFLDYGCASRSCQVWKGPLHWCIVYARR
jgi:hypothetical protein